VYITNVDELAEALRPRLKEYLTKQLGERASKTKFNCYVHDETTPSMCYNPKDNDRSVHCFGCKATHDIFAACATLENLPAAGGGWVTETLPHLADMFGLEVSLGQVSEEDKQKARLLKLSADISLILSESTAHQEYLKSRGWSEERLTVGSISIEELQSKLLNLGWTANELRGSLILRTKTQTFFGEDKVTFVIKDYRGRPVGFTSRNLVVPKPKYINTVENAIYKKREALLGIDTALATAKRYGLYVVEGPGDVAALNRVGVYNVAAICGTAFTADHFAALKILGIKELFFALDWDEAGVRATKRIFKRELKFAPGMSCRVVPFPETGETDVSDLLANKDFADAFLNLKPVKAFDWVLRQTEASAEDLCDEMVPLIASEPSAVRRELLTKSLSEHTQVSFLSISQDVSAIREGKDSERQERLSASLHRYNRGAKKNPSDIPALLAEHERDLEDIEKEYRNEVIGVNYQLSKYQALQEARANEETGSTEFKMTWFHQFQKALADGQSWVTGVLIYMGGRANSGKTATCIMMGIDVLLSDPDAIVLMQFTDDSYEQVEPRLKTNVAAMLQQRGDPFLKIGMAANPKQNINTDDEWKMYNRADDTLRKHIMEEKLVIIDATDGSTLSVLQKNLKYLRQKYPKKKVLVVVDNTHNYLDYMDLDDKTRMTRISTLQKNICAKYKCCTIATAEYRKNSPMDKAKIRFPIDDDLKDASAMTYRPNMIIHVYNDIHDRADNAEIYWTSDRMRGQRLPRLLLLISKNKISGIKDKLAVDLDLTTVVPRPRDVEQARREAIAQKSLPEPEVIEPVHYDGSIEVEADWE